MKKLLEKDKAARTQIKEIEIKNIVFKSIFQNLNFLVLTRWNAFIKLSDLSSTHRTKNSLTNRCVYSINKKRHNKLTNFSRQIFLKLIRSGQISSLKKSSW
jgi:hypothetical protein